MGSAEATAALDWDLLDAAPEWLAWPEADAAAFQRRVGALACAASIRLWIDAARLAALRSAIGDAYLQALLTAPAAPALPNDGLGGPRIDSAAQVAPMLRAAGISVLLAAVPIGPLRSAVAAVMAPAIPSPMALPLAESLVAQSLALAARAKDSARKELP